MWVVRSLARLVIRIALIAGATVVFALILAALSAGSFHTDARVLAIAFGCILLGMGGVGRGSNLERFADAGAMQAAWGTIPGFDALKTRPHEPQLNPTVAYFLSGLVLIALGVAVL